ncbi:MAG: hypothetical protein WC490_04000 [Candidatus Margulisiibacteriota bacterium]
MKKIIPVLLAASLISSMAFALTGHEIEMFKKLQNKWESKGKALMAQRNSVKPLDPRYTDLTKQIIKADYWENYYREAQIDRSTAWEIIKNTAVWSAQDVAEMSSIMWEKSEDLLSKVYEAKWSDLMKDAADSLMRQKLRKMMRDEFGGKTYEQIEDHIIDNFVLPKLDKSKVRELAEQAFGKAKDALKDAYVEEVKRQAKSRTKEQLQEYGEAIAKRVGGALDAAEFTVDMVQKYVLWDEAQPAVKNMLSQIQKISVREKCSHIKAFNIYLGKEKMTANPEEKPSADKSEKPAATPAPEAEKTAPAAAEPKKTSAPSEKTAASGGNYRDSRVAPTVSEVLGRHVKPGWKKVQGSSAGADYDAYYEGLESRVVVNYFGRDRGKVTAILVGSPRSSYNFGFRVKGKWTPSTSGRAIEEYHGSSTDKGEYIEKEWYPNGQIKKFYVRVNGKKTMSLDWDEKGRAK